jgi:hypothetical protein
MYCTRPAKNAQRFSLAKPAFVAPLQQFDANAAASLGLRELGLHMLGKRALHTMLFFHDAKNIWR